MCGRNIKVKFEITERTLVSENSGVRSGVNIR